MDYKISIIIPIYNVAPFLFTCLKSISKQSYKNIEIIAVNDGSTDSSGSIIQTFCQKDSRFICVTKKNGGLVSAITAGVLSSTGDFIAFVDGDDFVGPDFIMNFVNNLSTNVDVVAMGFNYFFPEKKQIKPFALQESIYSDKDRQQVVNKFILNGSFALSNLCFISRWNKLYKSSIIKKIISDYSKYHFFYGEDSFFTLLMLNNFQIMKCTSQVNSYFYCLHKKIVPPPVPEQEIELWKTYESEKEKIKSKYYIGNFFAALYLCRILMNVETLLNKNKLTEAKRLIKSVPIKDILKEIDLHLFNIKVFIRFILLRYSLLRLWKHLLKRKEEEGIAK